MCKPVSRINSEIIKEIADLFLEAATTKEEKIALGQIFWKLTE